MKIKYIALLLAGMFLSTSCEKDRRNADLYDSAVYFVNNATAGVCETTDMYDVQSKVEHPVYVYLSGYFGGNTTVSMSLAEDFIATYNESENTNLELLPSNCYEITKSSASTENRKARMYVTFDIDALKALSQEDDFSDLENYVVPLALKPTGDIGLSTKDEFLSYELIHPVLKKASMSFSISEDTEVSGLSYTMTMKSLFDNQFDLAWDIEFESDSFEALNSTESTDLGNSLSAKYALKGLPISYIENTDVNTLAAGENSVQYKVVMPEDAPYGNYYFNVKVKNCTLDGQSIPLESGDVNAKVKFTYFPTVDTPSDANIGLSNYFNAIPQSSMVFAAETYHDSSLSQAMDGDISTIWENRWNGTGAGVYTIPFMAVLDMGDEYTISALEIWRRSGSAITDLRMFEVYAAESVEYNFDGNPFTYSGLTYLGKVDFGDKTNTERMKFTALDKYATRYLLFKFCESNRGGTCISIAELGAWY
jgi:hypothetical protein